MAHEREVKTLLELYMFSESACNRTGGKKYETD